LKARKDTTGEDENRTTIGGMGCYMTPFFATKRKPTLKKGEGGGTRRDTTFTTA
jgi:hypothetical protein